LVVLIILVGLGYALFYPYPNPNHVVKNWPIQTIAEYQQSVQQVMKEGGVKVQFPPQLATYRKVSLSNGIELNVLEGGRNGLANQKLLIFLHGFPESALLCWGRYLDHFIEKGYWVIAPDMRGYNESGKPVPTGMDISKFENATSWNLWQWLRVASDLYAISYKYVDTEIARDLKLLVNEYAQREKAIFITHDWGSGAATYALTEYPEIFERAILGTPPLRNSKNFVQQYPLRFISQMIKSWYIMFLQIAGLSDYVFSRNNFALMFDFVKFDEIGKEGRMSAEEALLYIEHLEKVRVTTMSYYRGMTRAQYQGKKELLDFPIMFMHSERDRYLTKSPLDFVYRQEMTESAKSQSRVVELMNVPHWIQYYGEVVIPIIEEFIQK